MHFTVSRVLQHAKDVKPSFSSPQDVMDMVTNAVLWRGAEADFEQICPLTYDLMTVVLPGPVGIDTNVALLCGDRTDSGSYTDIFSTVQRIENKITNRWASPISFVLK